MIQFPYLISWTENNFDWHHDFLMDLKEAENAVKHLKSRGVYRYRVFKIESRVNELCSEY